MEFIRLNYKKLFTLLLFVIIFGGCFLFVVVFYQGGIKEVADNLSILIIILMAFYFVFALAGVLNFYRFAGLLKRITALGLFDNNVYTVGIIKGASWTEYNEECVSGTISGKYVSLYINFSFFNKAEYNGISIVFGDGQGYQGANPLQVPFYMLKGMPGSIKGKIKWLVLSHCV